MTNRELIDLLSKQNPDAKAVIDINGRLYTTNGVSTIDHAVNPAVLVLGRYCIGYATAPVYKGVDMAGDITEQAYHLGLEEGIEESQIRDTDIGKEMINDHKNGMSTEELMRKYNRPRDWVLGYTYGIQVNKKTPSIPDVDIPDEEFLDEEE